MKIVRRKLLHSAAGTVAFAGAPRMASALDYPTRPVHTIVGYPPGLAPDIVARLIAQALSKRLGQQFIIDDRPGAAGNIATDTVARAAADGDTLLLIPSTSAYNATLYKNLNFDLVRDIAPVASIALAPFVMVVTPSFPAKTVPSFIVWHAVYDAGWRQPCYVPYRSSYVPDLLGGKVQVAFTVDDEIANGPRSSGPLTSRSSNPRASRTNRS